VLYIQFVEISVRVFREEHPLTLTGRSDIVYIYIYIRADYKRLKS
jgi:hypothetical protein